MTDRSLRVILERLNKGQGRDQIFLRPLGIMVSIGKVWFPMPKETDSVAYPCGPQTFYFINNSEGIYIGIILDMGSDLHWYVLPKFRKQGYLTRAMKEVILLHIFQTRNEQKITISNSISIKNKKASKRIASLLGFERINEVEYILKRESYFSDILMD